MIETPEVINLQLYELEQILLEYYKEKIKEGNLIIDSKVQNSIFQENEVVFKLKLRIELENNINIYKEYVLEYKDIKHAINSYLNKHSYKMERLKYNFCEFTDEVLSIEIFVKKQKENKFKNKIRKLKEIRKDLLRCKSKSAFVTSKELQDILVNGEDIPTAVFDADKKEYIVKPRTIFGVNRRKNK